MPTAPVRCKRCYCQALLDLSDGKGLAKREREVAKGLWSRQVNCSQSSPRCSFGSIHEKTSFLAFSCSLSCPIRVYFFLSLFSSKTIFSSSLKKSFRVACVNPTTETKLLQLQFQVYFSREEGCSFQRAINKALKFHM